jgi:hypothetical protein
VFGTTLLFTAAHFIGDGVSLYVGLVRLLPAFLAFGIIRQTTTSFGAATLGHVTFNVIGTYLVVGTR